MINSIDMQIKCFGIAKEICSTEVIEISDDSKISTVDELRNHLNSIYPKFLEIKSYMIAINQAYGSNDQLISSADEIAIIPPVSGG